MTEQQEAVDALTKPVIETHIIDGRVIVSELPPLLVQLEAAIGSSIGGTVNGAGLASERNVLNNDALYEFMRITATVGDWCRMAGVQSSRQAMVDLLAWNHAVPDASEFFIRQLGEWRATITGRLSGAKPFELDGACPVCESSSWVDGDGTEWPRPLVVSYLRDDPMGTVTAVCRAPDCLAIWSGADSLRFLSAQIADDSSALLAFLRNQT